MQWPASPAVTYRKDPYRRWSHGETNRRLEVRLRPEDKRLIEEAVAVSGEVVSGFVVPILVRRAQRILRRHQVPVLCRADYEVFLDTLDRDDEPTPALVEAVRRRRKGSKDRSE